ncbi:hypothetical protein [uncultured Methylobacterium sp.]|uniref:hypothetical protein n=1 Tax=uncultured Methylobacterium sp. TaxID=157278 RepID=UPI002592BDC4|nr:hypothetical protein [uncultured Methylobacterium sp.]
MLKAIKIERITPRSGGHEEPVRGPRGYRFAHPRHGRQKHHIGHAVFVATLEEAADLVTRGYALRMERAGLRPSLVSARSLRVVA